MFNKKHPKQKKLQFHRNHHLVHARKYKEVHQVQMCHKSTQNNLCRSQTYSNRFSKSTKTNQNKVWHNKLSFQIKNQEANNQNKVGIIKHNYLNASSLTWCENERFEEHDILRPRRRRMLAIETGASKALRSTNW